MTRSGVGEGGGGDAELKNTIFPVTLYNFQKNGGGGGERALKPLSPAPLPPRGLRTLNI